jgi:hypothetical protein
MTEDEAVKKLKELETMNDPEAEHSTADGILCQFLRSLGYNRVADQFEEQAQSYWYA